MAPVPWALPRFWGTHGYGSEFQRVLKTPSGFGFGKCSFCIGPTPSVCTHGVDNGGHEVGSSTGKCDRTRKLVSRAQPVPGLAHRVGAEWRGAQNGCIRTAMQRMMQSRSLMRPYKIRNGVAVVDMS